MTTAPNEDDFLDIDPPADGSVATADGPAPIEIDIDDDGNAVPARDAAGQFTEADPVPAAATAPDAAPEAVPVLEAPSVTVKVGGRDVSVAGITRDASGQIVVPKDQVDEYLGMIRDALHHRTSFRDQLQSVREEATATRAQAMADVASAQVDAKRNASLVEQYDAEIAKVLGSEESVQRFAMNYGYEMQLLQQRLALIQRDVQAMQPDAPAAQSVLDQPDVLSGAIAQHAVGLMSGKYAGTFEASDTADIGQWLQKRGRRLIVQADADYPELGIVRGDHAVDVESIDEYLAEKAAAKHRAVEANRAAASNAASLATRQSSPAAPSRLAPPAITSRAASPTTAPAQAGPPKSRAEWEASLARLARTNASVDDFQD